LAVVPLQIGQAEHPLLEDRILLVPERQGQADVLMIIAEARQTVLVPAVGTAARVVVGEVVPGVPVGAVVLPDGSPGALTKVRAPTFPVRFPGLMLDQALALRVERHGVRSPVSRGPTLW